MKMKKVIRAFCIIEALLLLIGVLPVMALNPMNSATDFSYQSFSSVTGKAFISFDVTANKVSDGIIGIASASVTPKAFSDYSICFRIREGAFFDSNNKSDFDKVETVSYIAGKAYHVEIEADIKNNTYSAYVVIDSVRHTIADSYAFRASAGSLGKISAIRGGSYQGGLFSIDNITVESVEDPFTLPNFYDENMVLQRGEPHVIFGRAAKGTDHIEVKLEKGDLVSKADAEIKDGRFEAELPPLPASLEPYKLTVSAGGQEVVINSVYIGDVFLLAGQSNMAQNYNYQTGEQLGNGVTTSNLPERVSDERIKHFTINQSAASEPTFDVPFKNGSWQSLREANNKTLSYIGMFVAKERLKEEPDVPIGLISAAWNGTNINRWMRKSDDNKTLNYTPTNGDIFNNHIAPLAGYPLKAILWYQGESDASNPVAYAEAFPQLIRDWRGLWEKPDLPFLFVQLARYFGDNYAPLRAAQLQALNEENVGMAVILDTDKGTYKNIHPLGKEDVADRLHLLLKKYAYNEDITAEGPLFEKAEIEGDSITVFFKEDTLADGLIIKNTYGAASDTLSEFELAAENGLFKKADAVINPDGTVTVTSSEVPEPKYVRYAYSAVPENPNLFNSALLPASPFTTDTRFMSTSSFLTRAVDTENAPVQLAEFTATAFYDNIDGVISLTDSANTVNAWNSCGITIRFGTNGYLEYRDGTAFKTSSVRYSAGESFDIKLLIDFTKNKYSAVVNGELLFRDASFRSDALAMKNAARLLVRGGDKAPQEQFAVSGYSLSNPASESFIRAKNGAETVYIIVSPENDIYGAAYEDSSLVFVKKVPRSSGVVFVNVPDADNDKLLIWDDAMRPQD